jgi:predicted RNase H-like HicB family nuclease/predicted RNA binding protein YcfA (HicA-like mRNA interferase family)
VRLVESDGWRHVRTSGSHRHCNHGSKPKVFHTWLSGDHVPTGTLKSILKAAGLETSNESTLYVIFEQAEHNWAAYVPDLPGCITTGRTLEEAEQNIQEAVRGHLATLREFGEPVPAPSSIVKEIKVIISR